MWIKSISSLRVFWWAAVRAVEQSSPIFIFCFNDFDTKEMTKVYWQTSVLTPREKKKNYRKCSDCLHVYSSTWRWSL